MSLHLHRFLGSGRPATLFLAATFLISAVAPRLAHAVGAAPDPGFTAPVAPAPQPTPVQLFAAVERAWIGAESNALASLCDSAIVRVALKPGSPPATAPTLGAVAFLIHDQLRLVVSRRFHVVRLEVNAKKRTARAWARWSGEWGGTRGTRDVEVVLQARAAADSGWLLTEIRAND